MTKSVYPLKKLPKWETNLIEYVNQQLNKPFEWGRCDCTTFAVNCLKQMVGEFSHVELTYKNEREALAFQRQAKISVYDFMRLNMNVEPILMGFQQRGDFMFYRQKGFECCHVVLGVTFVSVTPEQGVQLGLVSDLPSENYRLLRVH